MRKSSVIITRITWARSGDFDARQALDGEHVGQVVRHAAEVINPVRVRNKGMPRLPLGHLLRAAVVEADVRHGVDDHLAVELAA